MPYLWSLVAALLALGLLGVVAVLLLGPLRRLREATALLTERVAGDVGLLRARSAALAVRFARRRA